MLVRNPKRTHNYTSPTLAPYPLVWSDGAGAGRCRMPGPCPFKSWPVDGLGRGWGPRHPARRVGIPQGD